MNPTGNDATAAVLNRLQDCYSGTDCAWERFYQPQYERGNFATRYHLVYPALAYFLMLKQNPALAGSLRPQLDTIYRGLLHPRTWTYWHSELGETTWPLQERNLTFAGRLATFIGYYIDAFGSPPADRIELGGQTTSYQELSENLWRQMVASPSGGVTCYHHQAMVMCNAELLINNLLHDRLFGTDYASANEGWLRTLGTHLVRAQGSGPLFYYGTRTNSPAPGERKISLGADTWSLFLMSAVVPEKVREWFDRWQHNITFRHGRAFVEIASWEEEGELSSTLLATAWAFALTKELGMLDLAEALRATIEPNALTGFSLDPLLSGLYLLGRTIEPGDFRKLVLGARKFETTGADLERRIA